MANVRGGLVAHGPRSRVQNLNYPELLGDFTLPNLMVSFAFLP